MDKMSIDDLKRSMIASGMCIDCVDKAVALSSEYAMESYKIGFDRGWIQRYDEIEKRKAAK